MTVMCQDKCCFCNDNGDKWGLFMPFKFCRCIEKLKLCCVLISVWVVKLLYHYVQDILDPVLLKWFNAAASSFSQWQHSFHWKLCCHWLKFLQCHMDCFSKTSSCVFFWIRLSLLFFDYVYILIQFLFGYHYTSIFINPLFAELCDR